MQLFETQWLFSTVSLKLPALENHVELSASTCKLSILPRPDFGNSLT